MRCPQTALVKFKELAIGLVFRRFKTCTSTSRLSSSFLEETGRVVADVLDHLDLLLALVLPVVDVVD